MSELIDEIERKGPEIDAAFEAYYAERDKLPGIQEKEGLEARQKYFAEVVEPIQIAVREQYIDFRFVVLSALSFNQYVVSRLGAEMDAEHFLRPDDPVYLAFRSEYDQLRSDFERVVASRLSPTDLP